MVSSEQVVKPRSRLAVVKPEVLHLLECQLLELCIKCVYELGQLKWVWFLIKWACPPKFLQPHHYINPRSVPVAWNKSDITSGVTSLKSHEN